MAQSVGLVHCASRREPFLAAPGQGLTQRDCSEQTAREIDEEVKRILDSAYAESNQILEQHRSQIDLVANELLQRETLDAETFKALIRSSAPASIPQSPP